MECLLPWSVYYCAAGVYASHWPASYHSGSKSLSGNNARPSLCRTELHFVRCIKPNDGQRPSDFDAPLTLHQLRCCGVLEVTRIARAGYPTRYLHRQFADRYHALLHGNQSGAHVATPTCQRA